ncbi:hypothetical protein BCR32DRAFT_272825 [Anaeromyces robustus]|uniref:Chitin-binding type-1 domain-containing protein n=1 Tax=Anaeromyces robustus TaxID=1754192 RepID=A0A1Y1VVD5_9FUNG|nr:hypothetical protein BCR32DRAFT_272825 [Anaeromyces robustus]|eukprot:ORX65153.1 hypothetical protein BCR32DRAFT_272825 [Anaeromyces robustus]
MFKSKFKTIFSILAITTLASKPVLAYKTIEEQCQIANFIMKIDQSLDACCTNERIVCDSQNNNIIQLNLNGLNLDYIEEDITGLPLVALDVSNNPNLEELPKNLGELASLQILNLSDLSSLTQLPDTITLLQNLSILILNNDVSLTKLPVNFGNISNLTQLYATSSGLETLPPTMVELKKLVIANFSSSTNLYGEVPLLDKEVICNYYDTNICHRMDVEYSEKWILPKDRYCETINISPITMGMINANPSYNDEDDEEDDEDDYGKCGGDYGICPDGGCCSKYGYCGSTDEYCEIENECQPSYGRCYEYKDGKKIETGYIAEPIKQSTTTSTTTATATATTLPTSDVPTNSTSSNPPDQSSSSSNEHRCGKGYGNCGRGGCCSKYGWCGLTEEYCDPKTCQNDYGVCWNKSQKVSSIKKIPGRCGSSYGSCSNNNCCSKYGWCGTTEAYCAVDKCQSEFGTCWTKKSSKVDDTIVRDDGRCGKGVGRCPSGFCCSKYGWCGASAAYCKKSQGCQKEFGYCV